ncbi:Monooxygenase [Pyrenophora tritici-repentis]|nr:Monooxygenase [Pyrenophora tritici-repentis]
MHFPSIFLFASITAARVLLRQESGCTNPVKRVEFRSLEIAARKQYTDAVKCLATKPSMLGLNTTLYDDFTYVHTHLNSEIHYVAQFLPWHRYFVHLYETQINNCGYTGPMVYWDWTLDVADVPNSEIFDADHGFGGNGGNKTETTTDAHSRTWKCLTDGPFKDIRPAYIMTEYAPHCLSRDFFDGDTRPGTMDSSAYTPAVLADINTKPTFVEFELQLENIPHNSIYGAVGGAMGDMKPSSSPNEPLFFFAPHAD